MSRKRKGVYEVGQLVSWQSQVASFYTVKVGRILAVVPANVSPEAAWAELRAKDPSLRALKFGSARPGESYLVGFKRTPTAKTTRIYWPRTTALKLARGRKP